MDERDAEKLKVGSTDTIRDHTTEIKSALDRAEENSFKRWLLITGRRQVVAGVLLFFVFTVLIGLTLLRPVDMRDLVTERSTVQTLFNTLLSGAILLVSIVVSINSVVFSQEITDIENQRERIDATMKYRRRIEELIDADITPARPAEFLRVVLHTIFRETQALKHVAADSSNDEFRTHVTAFADHTIDEIEDARATLNKTRFGTFKVLLAGLDYNYSSQLHAARGFKRKYGETLSDDERASVDALIDTLKFFATGREYFKSLYYKRELARLSARLLYVSLPVIVFTSYIILAMDANLIPEITLFGIQPLVLFVSFAYTVAIAPYVVLTSHVFRAATVTLRTLAAGPFILQSGTEIEELDWDSGDESLDWSSADVTSDD